MRTIIITDRVINSSIFEKPILYNLNNINIKPCKGCFTCIIKTPGRCIYHDIDIVSHINMDIIQSNLLLIITKVKYGCYDIPFKRLVERGLPLLMPFSKIHRGKIRYSSRSIPHKKIIIVGYGDISLDEQNIFNDIVHQNCNSICLLSYCVHICKEGEINSILEKIGGIQGD